MVTGAQPVISTNTWAESVPLSVYRWGGAQYVNLTIASYASAGDVQVYDLYIDPHMRF